MDTNKGVMKIATIGGIDIKAHWSWLIVLVLITGSLALTGFPSMMPGDSPLVYWVLGFIAAVMLFVSVLLHELSHSFVARARGYAVRDITLFIFGGVSSIEEESRTAGDEFLIAVVGPLCSLVLAAIFYALQLVVTPPLRRVGAEAASLLYYLAYINFALALFNMIPGYPLDGGRVLRAIIWAISGNMQSATRIAGIVGQIVAYGFIFWGLVQTFFFQDFFGGLWIAFIGWFLLNVAQQSVSGLHIRDMVRGYRVSQVMQPSPPGVWPSMSLAHLLTQYVLPNNLRALPVVDQDGRVLGIITLSDIRDIAQDRWPLVTVGQAMTGPDKLRVVTPQDSLERALQILSEDSFDQLPVVDQAGHLVGMLTRATLLRWLQIRTVLGMRQPPGQAGATSQPGQGVVGAPPRPPQAPTSPPQG